MKDPTIVRTFSDRGEAEIARSLLETEGIAAWVAADDMGGNTPPLDFSSGLQLDVPGLDESGIRNDIDALIVVACPEETQIARAVARGGLTEAEARARIAAQAPLQQKLAAADYVIDNESTLDDTKRQVRAVWGELLREGRSRA